MDDATKDKYARAAALGLFLWFAWDMVFRCPICREASERLGRARTLARHERHSR